MISGFSRGEIVGVLGWSDSDGGRLKKWDEVTVELLKMNKYGKFVLISNSSNDHILVLFDLETVHVAVAKKIISKIFRFVGAGRYRISGWDILAEWGSETCLHGFGSDRPQDKEEADRLLGLVSQAITENIKS